MGDGPTDEGTRFSRALSAAIEDSGLSLLAIQARLADRAVPVSVGALSYWRAGKRQPEGPQSRQAVDELEHALGLRTGELTRWLGPSRRSGLVRERASYDELVDVPDVSETLMRHMADLDLLDAQDGTIELTVHTTVDLDADGEMVRQASRFLLRAVRPGVRTLPLTLTNDGTPFPEAPRLLALHGCRVGRHLVDLASGVAAWELLLPRPLDTGETVVVEHDLQLPRLGERRGLRWEQLLVRPVRDCLVWVRFDPATLPATCEAYERESGHAEAARRLVVDPGGAVHHARQGFGPGALGIRWEW